MATKDDQYRERVRAWVFYDWANSAFATTILAAVLPVYYSTVAGSTLSSPAEATRYYTLTLSLSVLVVALLSPVLGAAADEAGWRKRFLLIFATIGIVATLAMFGIGEGDWLLASILFAVARIGFGTSNVFYDALLPHVARPDDIDRVSARGYAFGYLGGGLLLAANVVAIFALPDDNLGVRLSLASVGVWWALFSTPLIRSVAEPPGLGSRRAIDAVKSGVTDVMITLRGLGELPDLKRFLIAFLIYNDGINAVITVAAIYGAELGFGAIELTLAILLVQFVGIPYSLLFGSLLSADRIRRRFLTMFVIANIVLLPAFGIGARWFASADVSGASLDGFVEEGVVELDRSTSPVTFRWNGQSVEITHDAGPDHGDIAVLVDGNPLVDDDGELFVIDTDNPTDRTGETEVIELDEAGSHQLTLQLISGSGERFRIESIEVLPPPRSSSIPTILVLILVSQVLAVVVAAVASRRFTSLADGLTTKGAITIALAAYCVIAVWGFALDSVVEFWFLAWLVAVCQGGSQALSRSLFTRLIPERRSGEFFGFFSVVSKFASIISPLVFVASVTIFDSSRPAVLALVVFFAAGIYLLRAVDVERGRDLARRLSEVG
ncbi:MAG: MFS transporter [Acidimicrobiales bacterium]